MAGLLSSIGNLAKQAESDILDAPGEVLGTISNTVHAVGEGIAALPSLIGFPINKKGGSAGKGVEIKNLDKPAVAIIGGIRVSGQAQQIEFLLNEVDVLLLNGDLVYAFYQAQGLSVGSISVSEEDVELAKSILAKARAKGVKLVLPTDVVVADSCEDFARTKIVGACEIPVGWFGREMGPASVESFGEALNGAKTVIWNGEWGKSTKEGLEKKIDELSGKGAVVLLTQNSFPDKKK